MTNQLNKDKKFKRVGLALIILPILSISFALLALVLIGVVATIAASEFTTAMQILPGAIHPEDTVTILQSADLAFFNSHKTAMTCSVAFAFLVHITIAIFVIRIGLAWRRNDAFSQRVISGLHWIGVITVINASYGWCAVFFFEPSIGSQILLYSSLYDMLMFTSDSNGLGALTAGILLISLSWVLKHGKTLNDEQDLIV